MASRQQFAVPAHDSVRAHQQPKRPQGSWCRSAVSKARSAGMNRSRTDDLVIRTLQSDGRRTGVRKAGIMDGCDACDTL